MISVITTTGTGWVNENASLALEYVYGGDTAQVSMQYSYLPSPLSFLVDQGRAQTAGRALFDAVYARWEQRLPVFEQGRTVRFVAGPQDLERPDEPWPEPRVAYLQYPSDPSTRWIPGVTFLQLTADMALSTEVPPGHGHRFGSDPANAWAAILQPEGWTEQDTQRLRPILDPAHP